MEREVGSMENYDDGRTVRDAGYCDTGAASGQSACGQTTGESRAADQYRRKCVAFRHRPAVSVDIGAPERPQDNPPAAQTEGLARQAAVRLIGVEP